MVYNPDDIFRIMGEKISDENFLEKRKEAEKQANIIYNKDVNLDEIYKTYDSVLYNEETKTLVFYPPKKKDKEYTVLDGTKAIGTSAFLNAVNLKSVNINAPIDVENKDHFKIQDNAFEGCEKLNEVISNNSVFYVGYKAFKDCPNLKKVVVNDELFVPSNSKVFENSPNAMFYSQNSQWRPEN